MEGWRDGCRDLEDLFGGLEDQGWCIACGVYGHTVVICPFQGEEEDEPAQERKLPQLCPICGGEHYMARCPVHQEREEQGSPQSPPPAGGGRLLLPPPQPQVQQRPEEPENLFPWCTWCGEVDHCWRDCSEVPPSWCGRCEEGEHDWSGCPYASSPVPKREEPEHPQPKREEPERPQPKREEPERPTPEWEEPGRPTPEWEEPEVRRPAPTAAVSLPEIVGEVRRPAPTAASSLPEVLWSEPHQGELPATKKGGEVRRPASPAAILLQEWTSMLSAVPLPAGVLTALPAMGPLKPPFPAQDFVLDCWVFKGGGGR
ncbi:UNVERIFIED_CONTAM: hypothetical protein FKN15_067737 [Acipenser sinensis]